VHVADIVRCMRIASGTRGVFNVATGIETDVRSLFDGLQRAAGTAIEPVPAPLREGELLRSCLAVDRARDVLGFRAEVALDDGLRSTYLALVEEFTAR
jgi:UDP-glucose 4-epimerase